MDLCRWLQWFSFWPIPTWSWIVSRSLSLFAARDPDTHDLLPTRWGGRRCIDYFLTTEPERFRHMFLFDEAIADHRVPVADIHLNTCLSHEIPYRLRKTIDLSKLDDISMDHWFDWRNTFLIANPAPTLPCSHFQDDVDQAWKDSKLYYQSMLIFATKCAMRQLVRPFHLSRVC